MSAFDSKFYKGNVYLPVLKNILDHHHIFYLMHLLVEAHAPYLENPCHI